MIDDETRARCAQRDEELWRNLANHLVRQGHRDIMDAPANGDEALAPGDLTPPWTPESLLHLGRIRRIVDHFETWHTSSSSFTELWWPDRAFDPATSHGEQAFQVILDHLAERGLDRDTTRTRYGQTTPWSWKAYVEGQRARYRRRVAWLGKDVPWTPFQVDINSPSLFLDVTSPAVWQVIIDAFVDDDRRRDDLWGFLQNMRMASVEYIQNELPGPHGDPTRAHDPAMPLGYGTSTTMPSFGYRREHRTDIVFAGWAAAHNMDLFNPSLWTEGEGT